MLMILSLFTITVIIIICNQDTPKINLYVPIYYMIALLLFFIGKYCGEQEIREVFLGNKINKEKGKELLHKLIEGKKLE